MKTLLSIFLMCVTLTMYAQDSNEFKNQTIEFLELTGATTTFDDAISQIGAMVPEENKAAFKKEANGTLEGLFGDMAELYMAEFTLDEIKELTAFYKTEVGKKLASKQSLMTQKGMALGQNWGMEVSKIAQKYSGTN
ncbi:DUF2059 domain-containing protein [Bizionia sp. KMM 8389]